MAEQRDAREIIAEALKVVDDPILTWEEAADEILAALAAEGWSVERLEQVEWRVKPLGVDEPLYRVISPSTREAEG